MKNIKNAKITVFSVVFGLTALTQAACGYTPIYSQQSEVAVGPIQVIDVERNVGQRRIAQRVDQHLRRSFPSKVAKYRIEIDLEESLTTLAVTREATIERQQVNVLANVKLVNTETDEVMFTTQLQRGAAYNNEITPYSTEAGRGFARQAAADAVAEEIVRRVWVWLKTSELPEDTE